VKRPIVAAVAAFSSAALVAAAPAAAPKLPLKATYAGKNSHKKPAKVFVSEQGKRIGYTMNVNLPCANGNSVAGVYWTTEGKFYRDYWIRPKANGSFALNSANDGTWNGGTYKAWARFAGRFTSSAKTTGTFRGHIDYYNADGSLLTKCDTGPVTWSATRR
jgi:hypothetical protein